MTIINVRKAVMGWAKQHTQVDHATVHGRHLDQHVQHIYDLADRYARGMPDVAAAAALMRFPSDSPAKDESRRLTDALGERVAVLMRSGDGVRTGGYHETITDPLVTVVVALDLFVWLDIAGGVFHAVNSQCIQADGMPDSIAMFWADQRWLAHQLPKMGDWIGHAAARLHPELASMLVSYHAVLASAAEKAPGRA